MLLWPTIEEPVDWKKVQKTFHPVGIQLPSSSCPQQRVVLQVSSRAMYFLPPPYLSTPHARYFCASNQMEETADPHIAKKIKADEMREDAMDENEREETRYLSICLIVFCEASFLQCQLVIDRAARFRLRSRLYCDSLDRSIRTRRHRRLHPDRHRRLRLHRGAKMASPTSPSQPSSPWGRL